MFAGYSNHCNTRPFHTFSCTQIAPFNQGFNSIAQTGITFSYGATSRASPTFQRWLQQQPEQQLVAS
jgi:hypothetical protein